MKIAICEDNLKTLSEIENLVSKTLQEMDEKYSIDTFQTGESLFNRISLSQNYYYQVYFLDIELGKLSGIDVARIIREKDSKAQIIFITSHSEFMPDAFDVTAFHYLVKPLVPKKLKKVLKTLLVQANEKFAIFNFQINKTMYAIPINDILYFESDKRKINIYTNKNKYSFYERMSNVIGRLPKTFVIIHKSYVVNLHNVRTVQKSQLTMENGQILVISRAHVQSIHTAFIKYIEERSVW